MENSWIMEKSADPAGFYTPSPQPRPCFTTPLPQLYHRYPKFQQPMEKPSAVFVPLQLPSWVYVFRSTQPSEGLYHRLLKFRFPPMEKLWKSYGKAEAKLWRSYAKPIVSLTLPQPNSLPQAGMLRPCTHSAFFFIEKEQVRFFGGKESAAKRRASARPCQSNTAHTTPHKAAFGGSEDPTTPCKALGSCPPPIKPNKAIKGVCKRG